MNIRQSIENAFEAWSSIVVIYRWWVLLITFAITLIVIPQIRHGWVDVSIESFLPKNSPAIVNYNKFRVDYNYAPGALVVIEIPNGVFTLENLKRIKALHEYADQHIPYLKEIISINNMRYSRGEEDELIIGDLSEIWPETKADIPNFKTIVMNNPNYIGGIISRDEKVLNMLIEPRPFSSNNTHPNEAGLTYLQADEEAAFSEAVLDMIKKFSSEDFIIRNAGGPTMNLNLIKDMKDSTLRSTLLGIAIITLLLALLFRRLSGIILPLLVVFLSLGMTLALWPALGFAFNGNTQIIPTFILAVGIADTIHILSIFYKYYDNGTPKHEAITLAVKETAIAVLLTTITTAVGLLSFLASDMMPTQTMGIFGAIGVIMALIYTLTLVPSLVAIVPLKKRSLENDIDNEGNHSEKPSFILHWVDISINKFSHLGVHYAKTVVAVSAGLSLLAFAGLMQVKFSHDPVKWYPEGHELRKAIDLVDHAMDGSMSAYILLDTGETNGVYNPKFLATVQDIEALIKDFKYKDIRAINATSILSVLKETHQSLNANNPDFYVIPENQALIAQELLLFESGSSDIERYADFNLQSARIDVQLSWSNVLHYKGYVGAINQAINTKLQENGFGHVDIKFVGLLAIFGDTLYSLLEGTVYSYLMAFLFVFILMVMLMGNLRGGIIAFIPNVFPILITVGMIGWLNVPLNIITSTIGCIIIGISVDDTIHFMHHFKRYSQQYDDIHIVIQKTLQTCGRAIVFTSIVLVGGFIVHITGQLSTNKEFGWLLSFAIIIALLANLILAPALMKLFWRKET